MKKSEQLIINRDVKDAYDDLMCCIDVHGETKISSTVGYTAAEVFRTEGYTYVKSFGVIVAAIGHDDDVCYDFLRMVSTYTPTSAKHIRNLKKQYHGTSTKTYRPLK